MPPLAAPRQQIKISGWRWVASARGGQVVQRLGHRLRREKLISRMYTVYIIQSQSSSRYYIGITSNLLQRLKHHNTGANQSTKKRGPWVVVHKEGFADKKEAWLRERQIKRYKGGEAFKKLIPGGVA